MAEDSGIHKDLGRLESRVAGLVDDVRQFDQIRRDVHSIARAMNGQRPRTGEVALPRAVSRPVARLVTLLGGALLALAVHLHVEQRSRLDDVEAELARHRADRAAVARCLLLHFRERLEAPEGRDLRPMDRTSREVAEGCAERLRVLAGEAVAE